MSSHLLELDLNVRRDFMLLEKSFKHGENRQQISNRLIDILQKLENNNNRHIASLKILYNAYDLRAERPLFTLFILEEIKRYLNADLVVDRLSVETKRVCCELLYEINSLPLMESVIHEYKLDQCDDLCYKEIVVRFRNEKKIELLTRVLILLKCPVMFDIEIFLIPLYLINELSLVYNFLAAYPNHVPEFVYFLDDSLSKNSIINYFLDLAEKYHVKIRDEKMFTQKNIKRTISKLLNNYSFDSEYYPNSQKLHMRSILLYLIRSRFENNTLSEINFTELIKSLIDLDNVDLQNELLLNLFYYNMCDEAMYWIEYFQIPQTRRPYLLRNYKKTNLVKYKQPLKETTTLYKKLTIPESCIVMVQDANTFELCIHKLRKVDMIGIDAEWKPFCNQFGKESDLAILQLATKSQVFIVDVLKLKHMTHIWNGLINTLQMFSTVKIGFHLSGDLRYLYATVPNLRPLNVVSCDFIDLAELWKKLVMVRDFKIPFEEYDSCSSVSLSTLIKMCFGVELDKTNQFSNWEQRPLRKDQIIYAALDSHCLIEIYEFLEEHCYKYNVDFEKITNKLVNNNRSKKVFKSTLKTSLMPIPNHFSQIIQIPNPNSNKEIEIGSNFTLVLHMLSEELIKALRITGFQTIVIPQSLENKPKKAVNFYKGVFITLFKNYTKFYKLLPKGVCYGLKSNEVISQVQEIIQYFNVNIDMNSFYSKCVKCGSNLVKETEYKNIMIKTNDDNLNSIIRTGNSLASTSQTDKFNNSIYYDSDEIEDDDFENYDEYDECDVDYNLTNDYDECTIPVQYANNNDNIDPKSLVIFCNNCEWVHKIEHNEKILWYQTLNAVKVEQVCNTIAQNSYSQQTQLPNLCNVFSEQINLTQK